MALELHISVLDGEAVKETIVLSSGVHRTAKIGRMASAVVRLEDPSVARIHAVIEVGAEQATLVDMGTTAGTSLNGEQIQRSVLGHGDRIGLGDALLLVGLGKPAQLIAEEPEPTPEAETESALAPSAPVIESGERPTASNAEQATAEPEAFGPLTVPEEYQVEEIYDPDDVAPELAFDNRHALLELRRSVEGELVGVEHIRFNRPLILGESKDAHVFVGEDVLGGTDFQLVQYTGGAARLQWTPAVSGTVFHEDEEKSLDAWKSSGLARECDSASNLYELPLELKSRAQLEVGGWQLELAFVPAVKKPPRGLFRAFDFIFANLTLFSLLLHLLLGMYLYRLPTPDDTLTGEFFDEPDRFASLLLKPPKVEPDPDEQKTVADKKLQKKTQEVEKELVVADEEAPVDEEDARNRRKAQLKKQFSALFNDGGKGGTDALLGEAAGIGGNLEGGLVAVIGTRGAASSDNSMPTVGLSSSMIPGGKLQAEALAAPKVDTMGRLGGGKTNYGAGVKLKERKERKAVSLSTPTIMGALPREVVERVIRENKNQIRYCYEKELQRRQNLAGRVVVSWVISASGRVARVKIKDSTLGSKRTEKCIARRIKTWQFPRPAGGGVVTVNYPFIFRSG